MSTATCEKPMEKSELYIASETNTAESSARSLFTHQTGQALITLGTLFKHVPPFNESIDKNTSNTLISIGKKLKGK